MNMGYYCEVCTIKIKEWDRIFEHNGMHYHEECVELYPVKYVAFSNGDYICDLDEDDITDAYDLIDDLEGDD